MQNKIGKAVLAGFIGTLAMTVALIMAPFMGMPPMPIGKMLAGFMGLPEIVGWAGHFMIGIVLALIYAQVFASRLPGKAYVRGAIFSLLPWFAAQIMVNPMMGAGIFALNTPAPFLMVMGSLIGHLVYGVVIGGVYGYGSFITTEQTATLS
jgi:Family of unknown function (DUF6789)/Protein of unknown function (DUF2938)